VIVSFAFLRYQLILKSIYEQESYLIAFHEVSEVELSKKSPNEKDEMNLEISVDNQDRPKWHMLNRVQKSIFNKSKFPVKWARKTAMILFPFLSLATWLGPLYIMWESISLDNEVHCFLFIISLFISIISFVYIMGSFLTMDNFMFKSMSKWIVFRALLKEKPNIIMTEKLKKFIKKYQKFSELSE